MEDLSPWDAWSFFDIPTEVTITLGASPVSVAKANPNRVALIFSTPNNGGNYVISINPNFTGTAGMQISSTALPFILTHRDVGPLVQLQWFASSAALGAITVTEVVLNKWPSLRSVIDASQ